jgi:hypothetical protein
MWGKVADAMIDGLADPDYPDERRESLYDALAGARECLALCRPASSPSDALLTSRLMLSPEVKRSAP